MAMLEAEHLRVRYGSLTILDDISLAVEPGRWLMIAGPNGAGKSTLLGALAQTVPHSGTVRFEGRDLAAAPPSARARLLGMVRQQHAVGYAFTVEEVVHLGRYAHSRGLLAGASPGDDNAVEEALASTGMAPLRNQSVLTLSGGELQRVFLAQVLAQQPRVLLLDEPTNHLDLVYQQQVFELVRTWVREPGRAVVSVVHDLSLARAYGTHALLLDRGRAVASGSARAVFTGEHLNAVYGMDVPRWFRGLLGQWT